MQTLAVTIDVAAAMISRCPRTVYRMIEKGELCPVRYGGRQSIPVSQLQALVAGVSV